MAHSKFDTRKTIIGEQMNMFGERDPVNVICEWLTTYHKELIKRGFIRREHRGYKFSDFVLNYFSSYAGGTAHGILKDYFDTYDFSPTGVKLNSWGSKDKELFVKKSDILKMLNIKDDHKDLLKDEEIF